jgi:hypothetical protein
MKQNKKYTEIMKQLNYKPIGSVLLRLCGVVVSFFKRLKSKYTMTYNRSLFIDTVSGRMVNEYVDCYGHLFMANSRLGWRIKKN